MNSKTEFYGWKLVGVVWLIYFFNLGFGLYGATVINPVMLKDIPMDRATYGFGFALLNLSMGGMAFLQAASVNKFGVKATFLIGSTLVFLGSLWMYYVVSQPWHYFVGYGVIVGTGLGFGSFIALSTTITRWFVRYRGRAMAIVYTASGVAGFIMVPLLNKVMLFYNGNWRLAWIIVAGSAIVSGSIALLFVKEDPLEMGQVPDGIVDNAGDKSEQSSKLITSYDWTPKEAYRTFAYWMVFIGTCATQFPWFIFMAHFVLHLKGLGVTSSTYALSIGLATVASIVGRLLGGVSMDKIPARFAFGIGLCGFILGSVLAIKITDVNLVMIYAAAMCYGFSFGWCWVCLNTTTGHFFGVKAFAKLNGTNLAVSALVCFPAASIGGKLFDIYQNYTPTFLLNIGVAIIGIIAVLFARKPSPVEIEEEVVAETEF